MKNLEPAGTPGTQGKKNKKTKQQFDFSFEASGKTYTCRTGEKTTVNATDFVVGSGRRTHLGVTVEQAFQYYEHLQSV